MRWRLNAIRKTLNRKFLVPINWTEESATALSFAATLARQAEGQIILLHVVRLNILGMERGIARASFVASLRQEAQMKLANLASGYPDVAMEIRITEGVAGPEIVKQASAVSPDCIVMGTRGRARWLSCLFPDTARHVVKNTACPVWLVLRATKEKERALILVDRSQSAGSPQTCDRYENSRTVRTPL